MPLYPLGEDREKRSPKYGEAGKQKKKIIKQETGLTRNQRFQFVLAAQVRSVLPMKINAHCQRY